MPSQPGFNILGQAVLTPSPAVVAIVDTTGGAVLTYLSFANKSSSVIDTVAWAIVPDGDTLADKHYQDFAIAVPAGPSSYKLSISIPVGFNGKIYAKSANGTVSMTVGGMEYTA